MFGTALRCSTAQRFAEILGARGRLRQAFQQRAEIETRSGGDDWHFSAETQPGKDFFGAAAIVAGGEYFVRLDEVDEVMRDFSLSSDRNLRGADVEVAIDLGGIANEDFGVEAFGERDSERRFAGSSGAEDDDEGSGTGRRMSGHGVCAFYGRRDAAHRDDCREHGGMRMRAEAVATSQKP